MCKFFEYLYDLYSTFKTILLDERKISALLLLESLFLFSSHKTQSSPSLHLSECSSSLIAPSPSTFTSPFLFLSFVCSRCLIWFAYCVWALNSNGFFFWLVGIKFKWILFDLEEEDNKLTPK